MIGAGPKKRDWVSRVLVGLLLVGAVMMGWQEVLSSRLLPIGSTAPDFSVKRLDGSRLSLSSLRGQVVLVDFWATWCPPCRAEMPYLVELADAARDRGVTLVAIDNDDLDDQEVAVRHFVDGLPALRDHAAFGTPEVSRAYFVRSLPTLYVLDRHGGIVAAQAGQVSEAQISEWIEEALRRP